MVIFNVLNREDSTDSCSEPGYYEDGKFGIRIENILVVKKANRKFNFGDKGFLEFENVTMVNLGLFLLNVFLIVFKGPN
jgi:Xaa-Pro aminopeptidase